MWQYQKRLQYPVNIKNTNPKLAQYIVSQYGGTSQNVRARDRRKFCVKVNKKHPFRQVLDI